MADKIKILWADDEIDILKPQLFFLEKKGYEVMTVSNGHDAIETLQENRDIDVVFLDESMPGLTGLETLSRIKAQNSSIPVVMITKNEAENIMEEAIGSQINDYLIKPVNPNQILMSLKKIVDAQKLVSEKTATEYQQEFRNIGLEINEGPDYQRWVEIYKKIISWEMRLDSSDNPEMNEILQMQKKDANREFSRYINKNYLSWIKHNEGPSRSHILLREKVFPFLNPSRPAIFLLLDNLRYDQWKIIEPVVLEYYRVEKEDYFYSILPTSTQYSRNAIFSGMMPSDIQKHYPQYWVNDHEEGGKNLHEEALFHAHLKRMFRREIRADYYKVTNTANAKNLNDQAMNFLNNDITAIVYNFIDMLSHARTEMEVLKELARDEKAYRSLTLSWFVNSPIWSVLKRLAEKEIQLFITTDHGTIRVGQPSKVIGDKETTTNLRYKVGRNMQYSKSDVLDVKDPAEAGLPRPNVSSTFIFAKEDLYFLYPNNYNHFNHYYRDTFQHGGISMEEMICPIIRLVSK
ncbi:MAG TPA: PglZ domain-containing protein [Saprospiraceae bacterium]|nr:PglZ domain-containing protein [Saprospiraceae bacterium]